MADFREMTGCFECVSRPWIGRRPWHFISLWAGKDLDFQIGPRRLAFTPETFILSFSLPNFHFHAVTAYDILRTRGVPLGKRDYEGRLRTRSA